VLYAILDCTGSGCDIAYEAWGEAQDLEVLTCEECGSPLQIVAFANTDRGGAAPGSVELQQRHAA